MKIMRSGCRGWEPQRLDSFYFHGNHIVLMLQLACDQQKRIIHHHHAVFGEEIGRT